MEGSDIKTRVIIRRERDQGGNRNMAMKTELRERRWDSKSRKEGE